MARLARVELFAPDEIAVVHVINRVVRRCFLMGTDSQTGKCYDHRKRWMENELRRLASNFGIDLLAFAIMSNHFHLVLRSRPDVVSEWSDTEVARRWRLLCPLRKHADGSAKEPSASELNSICADPPLLAEIRSRLSDISWWMRLLCQRIAQYANREDEVSGKFWESRYRAVRLIDDEAILACSAYVDLNPIRAGLSKTLENSRFTSIRRRLHALKCADTRTNAPGPRKRSSSLSKRMNLKRGHRREDDSPDAFLCPLELGSIKKALKVRHTKSGNRCSDKGFLSISIRAYVDLLDWTARQSNPQGERGDDDGTPRIFKQLRIKPSTWCALVTQFGGLFSLVGGQPRNVDSYRSRQRRCRFYMRAQTRELLSA